MTNQHVLRVSLATTAKDFEPLVLDPGLPLLDSSGSSEEVVRTWLKRFAAKPIMQGDRVDFILCDDQGQAVNQGQASSNDVTVEPITANDLAGTSSLKAELSELEERLASAEPSNDSERRLKQVLTENLAFLTKKSPETHRACQLFKYERAGKTSLVWCWGYQRKSPELNPPVICTNPNCQLLFLKRDGNACPDCKQSAQRAVAVSSKGGSPLKLLIAGALLLAAVGLGYWLKPTNEDVPGPRPLEVAFIAQPTNWEGPIGASVPLVASLKGAENASEGNVIRQSVVVVDDPTVLRLAADGTSVQAKSVGKTVVHYYYGEHETQSTFIVQPASMPESLSIDPVSSQMAKGATSDYRVIGTYADGSTADLTDVSTVNVKGDAVYESNGKLQGVREGTAKLEARYRPDPSKKPIEASAEVTVESAKFDKLNLVLEPKSFSVGQKAAIAASLASTDGQTHPANNASGLRLSVSPSHIAKVKDGQLIAMSAGEGVLRGTYEKLSAEIQFSINVSTPKAVLPFAVKPNQLQLVVGETASLKVAGADQSISEATSSDAAIAQITSDLKVIGVSPGEATITVHRGNESAPVTVEVKSEAIKSLAIEPENIKVPIGESVPFRVVGLTEAGDQVEIDWEQLTAQRLPPASQATVDLEQQTIRGLQPSDGSVGRLVIQFRELTARATVEVLAAPALIELSPSDSIDLPVGQKQQIHVFAVRGGDRTKLEPKQVRWKVEPDSVSGLRFDRSTATVTAVAASDQALTILASLPGGDAEVSLQVRAVTTEALKLSLRADKDRFVVGEIGQVQAELTGESGSVLSEMPAQFTSSDEKVVRVDPSTGAFKAMAEGTATISATHPDASDGATIGLNVLALDSAKLAIFPSQVTVAVGNRIELSAKLLSVDDQDSADGISIASNDLKWSFEKSDAVRWEPPFLTGRKASEPFEVRATYKGKEAVATVEVTPSVDDDGQQPTIRVQPSEAKLAVDQSVTLRVEQQSVSGDSWTEVSPKTIRWKSPSAVVVKQDGSGRAIATLVSNDDKGPLSVSATYLGSEAELLIEVLDEPPAMDSAVMPSIRREPTGNSIRVGQSQTYMVVAGDTPEAPSIPNVQWMPAFENANVVWAPPMLTAKQAGGTEKLWVEANGKRINFETELVDASGDTKPPAGMAGTQSTAGLTVAPNPIELLVGQSLAVGDGLTVTRDGEDVSSNATIKSTDTSIVRYSKDTNSIVGVSPGETELTIYQEKNQQIVPVKVSPSGLTDADTAEPSTAQINPAGGQLQIGQTLPLRVTAMSKDGNPIDRTDSAIFGSSDTGVIKVDGNQVVGVSAGEADVEVSLPGHDPITATFSVVAGKLTNLIADPASLELSLGGSSQLAFSATDAEGNPVKLSVGELDLKVGGDNPDAIEVDSKGLVKGMKPGEALVLVTGTDGLSANVEVTVKESQIKRLRLDPARAQIAVGEKQSFRVLATDDDSEKPVDAKDGVTTSLSDPSVARLVEGGLIVEGTTPGRLTVTAKFGGKSATATMIVVDDPAASLKNTATAIEKLRFDPDSMKLELDAKAEFKVIAIDSAGAERPAVNDLQFVVEPVGALEVLPTSTGFLAKAIKPGKVNVTVKSGDATSVTPLLVEVVDTDPENAKLVVSPSTLRVEVGQVAEIESVEVQFDAKQQPLPVLPKFESSDPSIVSVGADGTITGVKEGEAELSVTTLQVPYQSLSTTVRVTVDPPNSIDAMLKGDPGMAKDGDEPGLDIQLVMSGPGEITVGATAEYKIKIVSDSKEKDVTNESVQLLVEPLSEADKVTISSGGRVRGVKPGQVTLRAQYNNLISNPVPVVVSEVANRFQSIVLELSEAPMSVGETRAYKLWGIPPGGGTRQDLTDRVTTDLKDNSMPRIAIKQTPESKVSGGNGSDTVVKHQPPTIVATSPGDFQIIAAIGTIKSQPLKITVVPADGREAILRADPSEISIQVGQTLPPLTIYSAHAGASPKPVNAELVSDDPAILKAEPGKPGIFTAVKPGKTTITATFNEATVKLPVTVVGNRVEKVSLSDVELINDGFTLKVNLEGQHPEGELEYRAVTPDGESKTQWKAASGNDSVVTAELPIESLKRGDKNRIYYLIIESRLKGGGSVQRYPVAFRLLIDAKQTTAP